MGPGATTERAVALRGWSGSGLSVPRAVEAGLGGKGRGRAHVGLGRARVWAVRCGEKERGAGASWAAHVLLGRRGKGCGLGQEGVKGRPGWVWEEGLGWVWVFLFYF